MSVIYYRKCYTKLIVSIELLKYLSGQKFVSIVEVKIVQSICLFNAPLDGDIIWPITLRMIKFHPITAFMKTHANFKKYIDKVFFLFKYLFPTKFKIHI